MRQSLSRLWTPEEDARLRQLAAAGASKIRIAAALKRGPEPVLRRAIKLGISIRRIPAFAFRPRRDGLRTGVEWRYDRGQGRP
jgi:hypothetical protein